MCRYRLSICAHLLFFIQHPVCLQSHRQAALIKIDFMLKNSVRQLGTPILSIKQPEWILKKQPKNEKPLDKPPGKYQDNQYKQRNDEDDDEILD